MLGIGFQDTFENISKYARDKHLPYNVAYDEGNRLAQSYGLPYGAGVVFISKGNIVTGRFRSGFTEADLIRELGRVLK